MSTFESRPTRRLERFVLRVLLRSGIVFGVFVAAVQAAVAGPILPNSIAARFAWDGHGIGWMRTPDFFTIQLVGVAGVAVLFIGGPLLLRVRARRRARPEIARITDFEEHALFFGLITTGFALALSQLVVTANLASPARLEGGALPLVAGYVVFAVAWTAQMIRRFRRQTAPAAVTAAA